MDMLKRPLADYIRERFGPTAVLEKEERFPRGSSRLTYFIDYRPAPGEPVRSLVFRGDFLGGSTIHSSLEQEYFMYDRLSRSAVPVAKVLFWDDDPEWVARPFYVREQIEGHWDIPNFRNPDPAYDTLRIEASKEHMRKLGIVHNVDWKALGFDERLPPPQGVEDAASHFVDAMLARLRDFQREPMPIVVEAAASLKKSAPVAPKVSLCKGTNGLGEEVFKDGVIVAMSDWEEASIGDPAADFASLQDLIPEIERDGVNIWGLEKALAYYRETSGIALDIENVRYYQRLRAFGSILYGHKAAVITHDGNADIRHGWTGTEVAHLMKRLVANNLGIGKPIHPEWLHELNETVV
jgi:aminoglycoside phosphotransferase (APT) family kinase protein